MMNLFVNSTNIFNFQHRIRFRLIDDFNRIYKFLVFIFIAWSILAICSILIVLNAELVKSIDLIKDISHNIFNQFPFFV